MTASRPTRYKMHSSCWLSAASVRNPPENEVCRVIDRGHGADWHDQHAVWRGYVGRRSSGRCRAISGHVKHHPGRLLVDSNVQFDPSADVTLIVVNVVEREATWGTGFSISARRDRDVNDCFAVRSALYSQIDAVDRMGVDIVGRGAGENLPFPRHHPSAHPAFMIGGLCDAWQPTVERDLRAAPSRGRNADDFHGCRGRVQHAQADVRPFWPRTIGSGDGFDDRFGRASATSFGNKGCNDAHHRHEKPKSSDHGVKARVIQQFPNHVAKPFSAAISDTSHLRVQCLTIA